MSHAERLAKVVEAQPDENLHYQAALMAMENDNELMAIYSLFRSSTAFDIPRQMVNDSMLRLFQKNYHDYNSIKSTPNIELRKKFCIKFVRLVAILSNFSSLEMFDEVWSSVASSVEEFLTSKSTTQLDVLQVIAIIIFIVHLQNRFRVNVGLHCLLLHKYALLITFDIVGCLLKICASANDVLSTSLLPSLLVAMEWLVYSTDMTIEAVENDSYGCDVINVDVEERLTKARWFFWINCERFVKNFAVKNNLQGQDELEARVALWEDSVFQGFAPFAPVHLALKLSRPKFFRGCDRKQENKICMARIMEATRKAMWIYEAFLLPEKGNSGTADDGTDNEQCNIIGEGIGKFQDKHAVPLHQINNVNGGDKLCLK